MASVKKETIARGWYNANLMFNLMVVVIFTWMLDRVLPANTALSYFNAMALSVSMTAFGLGLMFWGLSLCYIGIREYMRS